jgi:hypothetical protein
VRKNKRLCSSRWIISCTLLCATVAKDRLPDAQVGSQTASKSHATVQPCTSPTVAVVKAVVVVVLSSTRAGLYVLLQCVEDSEYGCKTYDRYFEVFHVLLAKDGESSPTVSENFQYIAA